MRNRTNKMICFLTVCVMFSIMCGCNKETKPDVSDDHAFTTNTSITTMTNIEESQKTEETKETNEITKASTITTKPSAPTKQQVTQTKPNTTKKETNTTKPNNQEKVVQCADPNTGISWDGISPIIYTYPDGSTGTEKKDGATYELEPGIIGTYNAPDPNFKYSNICSDCGKKQGDGRNDTCVCYLMVDTCPLCKETGVQYHCHTCKN